MHATRHLTGNPADLRFDDWLGKITAEIFDAVIFDGDGALIDDPFDVERAYPKRPCKRSVDTAV